MNHLQELRTAPHAPETKTSHEFIWPQASVSPSVMQLLKIDVRAHLVNVFTPVTHA